MKIQSLVMATLVAAGTTTPACASDQVPTVPAKQVKNAAPRRSSVSYIIQAPTFAAARAAVRATGAAVSHELPIINAVAAPLTPAQVARLRANHQLTLTADRKATVAGGQPPSGVQPYVVEHTHANVLHSSGITGMGVTIAFLDTGWWNQHAVQTDSANKPAVLQGYDAIEDKVGVGAADDHYGHGSHVLSIATNSALADDGTYVGMAPGAARVIVRAFDKNGQGTYADAIRGISWILANAAKYKIRIVNMSFGATPQSAYWDDPLAQSVMKLWQAGIVVVAAAGNGGPTAQTIDVPGNVPYVITVGAMTDNYTTNVLNDDRLASFSSTGPTVEGFVKPEVVAPGGHVTALMKNDSTLAKAYPRLLDEKNYFYMSGTSMSAAVVSGTVALMLQAQPNLTPDDVKCRLMSSAHPAVTDAGSLAYSVFQQGAGQIDAYSAVFSQASRCANVGLDINADVAGTQHFGGPANQDANGNYYVMDMSNGAAGTPLNADGYTWSQSYPWSQGYAWSSSYTWSKSYTWSQSYTWSKSYTWSRSYTWSKSVAGTASAPVLSSSDSPASVPDYVDNE